MIIENDYGAADLDYSCFYENKKIAICISGGIDSTLLLYFYSNFFKAKNIKYNLITYNDKSRGWIKNTANKIAEILPGHTQHFFPEYDSEVVPLEQAGIEMISDLHENGYVDIVITGLSKNPPLEVCQSFNTYFDENRTDIKRIEHPVETLSVCRPFNVNKKWIVEEYKNNNLTHLLPITVSCGAKKNFPCGKCFRCKKREWALSNI